MTSFQDQPLWTPDQTRIDRSPMQAFARFCAGRAGEAETGFDDYDAFHQWSVSHSTAFWDALWDYCDIAGHKGERLIENETAMPGAKFFPDASLSYAENMLRPTGDHQAIVFRSETGDQRALSWDDLHALVSRLQQAFRAAGVKSGDRIAAMVPNLPETIACMLAANALGAIWSSCSPDFGVQGVLDRFTQIEPTLFIACDGYWYAGKEIDLTERLAAIIPALGAKQTILLSYRGTADAMAQELSAADEVVSFDAFIAPFQAKDVVFERLPFDHPLYILFSSGTTGVPKCIVHGQGGVLMQHLKEHRFHCGITPEDRVFYFTTCGWMMWNWLVSALAARAIVMLYDGSPFHPDGNVVFNYVADEKITFFGTSAKFIDAVRTGGLRPMESHDLSAVHTIASTGSPLAPENFRFVYDAIKADVHLASVSGGTDIVACFVAAVPSKPVYTGEIQGPTLGMATEVWDDDGQPVRGEKGELVCTVPFPTMPLQFWNDPDGAKYHGAYFERFDNIWCHGDFAEWTDHGGMIIHGRSDATLNPGGVRIGTAEIYNQVEQMDEVLEALCIGQHWQSDTRVVLFVRLADGVALDEGLEKAIRQRIRTGASPRHVPAVIVPVEDIPRTKSGKITELAVRDVVHGRTVKNKEALANPEALDLFVDLPALKAE